MAHARCSGRVQRTVVVTIRLLIRLVEPHVGVGIVPDATRLRVLVQDEDPSGNGQGIARNEGGVQTGVAGTDYAQVVVTGVSHQGLDMPTSRGSYSARCRETRVKSRHRSQWIDNVYRDTPIAMGLFG